MTPDEIIQKLESSWAHEQNGSLWKKWVPSNPVNAQKLRAYWSGPLDAAPPLVTSEYGLARLDQMVAHHGLKRGVQLSEIIIAAPTTTYDRITNWARPAFTVLRDVPFTTVGGLNAAIADMTAGDHIHYTGTGVLNNTTSGGSIDFLQSKNPASTVVIDLGTVASGNYVKFSYTGTSQFTSCYCYDCSNIRIYGGEFTTPNGGGTGIMWFGQMNNVLWWDFYVHDTGSDAIDLFCKDHSTATGRAIQNCSFRGEVSAWGQNTGWDPHAEKGTGLHGAQIADSNPSGDFKNNIVALYGHDSGCGELIQFGQPNGGADLSGNTFYFKAVNLTKVATSQIAANGIDFWGSSDFGNTVVGWAEGTNLQSRVVSCGGGNGTTSSLLDAVVVQHGRHTNTNQNPNLGSTYTGISASQPYDDRKGITYQNCL